MRLLLLFSLSTFLAFNVCAQSSLELEIDESQPPLAFAASEIRAGLQELGHSLKTDQAGKRVTIDVKPDDCPTGYKVISSANAYRITASSAVEGMYAGLAFIEALQLGQEVWRDREQHHQPYLKRRGLKFNIPLDARTPSYDDSGDAAQRNIAEMWNFEFWRAFLDDMTRHRYNVLTLWNPHPFPSMVKMEIYPEVALDDVCVTTLTPTGRENEWGEPQLVSQNVIDNLETVRVLSIDEKISYWRRVMQHAADRGIDLYFITWNICPNSVAQPVNPNYRTYGINVDREEPGKYSVTHQIDNPATIRYLRESVKAFLLTYPLVKGIGVTAGEHMPKEWDTNNREQWLWETYGKGILDAKREQPNRTVEFIHRVWYSDLDEIMKHWGQYPDPFTLSFKYAKARLYSSPKIPFARKQIDQMKPLGLKSWWNLRNDDLFVYRWGDPDYVRAFLKHFELEATAGYHMGSDGYVWGREFVSLHPKSPRELEISKHWYNFLLWGRLGYEPELDRDYFVAKLAHRHPKANADQLYETWQTVSKIVPQVNQFYWQNWDHMWSVEACLGHVEGFHEVDKFIDAQTMEGSGILNVRRFVKRDLADRPMEATTPVQVADRLDELATTALAGAQVLTPDAETDRDLNAVLVDIQAMAWLGRYYADKIRAAISLARLQETGEESHRAQGVAHMTRAHEDCARYAAISQRHYHPQMLARPGRLDWEEMLQSVALDIEIIANWKLE